MSQELIVIDNCRKMLAVGLTFGTVDRKAEDFLFEAMLRINQAVSDFAFMRIDSETLLDRIESEQALNMDEYLETLETSFETLEIL